MISVLLPYRNAAATLREAVESVLADLAPHDELVAVDDGSSDDSTRILAELASRDARIVRVESGGTVDRPAGIATALTRGHAAARRDALYLGRMDADDVSLPGRFAAQRALLERDPMLAAVGTRVEPFVTSGAVTEGMQRYVAWQNGLETADDHARAIFVEAPLCHPSTLLRRSALERVGGYRDVPWPEDYDLWLRFDEAGLALAKVPAVFLRWRMRAESLTRTDVRTSAERLLEGRAAFLAKRLVSACARSRAPFAIWGAGQTGRRLARALEPHRVRPAFFVDIDPRKIGRTARGVRIVTAEEGMTAASSDHVLVVVAVGEPGARDIVRARLANAGLREAEHYVCAA